MDPINLYIDESEEEFMLNPKTTITYVSENVNLIYDFNKIDKPYLQPKEEPIDSLDKYNTACYLTSNLSCSQFLKNIKENKYQIEYYDSPYHEFHVQSLFFKNVECIKIIDVDLNLDFFIHLSEKKNVFDKLTSIVMNRCNINEDMLEILCPDLEFAFGLSVLDLSENPIGDSGFKHILNYLYDWTSLKSLIFIDTQLTNVSFEALGGLYLQRRLFLTFLDLSRNSISKAISVKRLLAPLNKQKPPLEKLSLRHCGLEGLDIALHLSTYLRNLRMLKKLDLSFNLFQEEEIAVAFGELLMESHLEKLNLSFNFFKESQVLTLLDCLFNSPPDPNRKAKTLVIQNFSIPEHYQTKNPLFLDPNGIIMKHASIIIKHAGIRKLFVTKVEDFKHILVKRFNCVYKKMKQKKDVVLDVLAENLPKSKKKLARIKVDDFKDALTQVPIDEIEPSFINEIVAEFGIGNRRCNALLFMEIYEELFPPKTKKKSAAPTEDHDLTEENPPAGEQAKHSHLEEQTPQEPAPPEEPAQPVEAPAAEPSTD